MVRYMFRISFFRLLTLISFLIGSHELSAQKKSAAPISTDENNLILLRDTFYIEDSTLVGFQNYYPLTFTQDLGNISTPFRYLHFKTPEDIGFRTGWHTPTVYFNTPSNARYYKASVPYTYANYTSGQRPSNTLDFLQQMNLLHTQNWGPLFNIGVRINNNRCNGFSSNAQARTSSGEIFSWFHTRNYRYQILANVNLSSSANQLNGGIVSDSSYENSSGVAKEIDGLLNDSSVFRYRTRQYYIRHFYRFGEETQRIVTRVVKRDSIVTDTLRDIDTRLQVGHSILFAREAWVYQDNIRPMVGYFENYYFDTLRTKDSLHQNTLTNVLDITYKIPGKAILYAAYENRLHWIYTLGNTNLMNENFIKASVDDTLVKNLILGLKAKMVVFNNFKEFSMGDVLAEAKVAYHLKDNTIDIHGSFSKQSPNMMQVYYPGNHFYWYNNNFEKTSTGSLVAGISNLKYGSLHFTASRMNGYLYFDSTITVRQALPLTYMAVQWKQDFKFHALHYMHQAILQKSSNSSAMPLPDLLVKATLMYDGEWFKKALHIQFGVTANYFSKYDAPAFMPSVNVFYVQHQNQIGNYPQLDGFVNLQIQRVRIFVMMEHFNQGLQGFSTASYITPHYPLINKEIRFGVSWSFYN